MVIAVNFGNGGAASVSSLTKSTDQEVYQLLTVSTTQEKNGVSLETGPLGTINVAGTGSKVDVGYDANENGFTFDVSSEWNSVKNALIKSERPENIKLKDFVHVDVQLGGTGSSNLEVLNTKRGNISTGAGNDTVAVSLLSNENTWVNAFNIDTGAGNDTINVKRGAAFNDASSASPGGIVAGTYVANGGVGVTNGRFTSVKIDAGTGNDEIDLSSVNLASSVIIGGKGMDRMTASGGTDTFVFNKGDMGTWLATDTIFGFDASMDKLKLVGTTIDDWAVTSYGVNTLIVNITLERGDESIILSGVRLENNDWFTA